MRILKAIVVFVMVVTFLMGFAICAFPIIQNIAMDYQLTQDAHDFFDRLDLDENNVTTLTEWPTSNTEPTVVPREHEDL